ncbi:PaaI family thioesterase [Aurantimonas sp. VKM B-3413]|uniref:PaaI family thioesterase n=1 Tax=Aurantimonas sp. VKM B-3413 TaxID=2779401 RepID=UPI001E3BF645|nr:PaaI family thioesterase [Aurantimonas sp. VKM B-3413]MCB8836931.1 PaaI family thioesterase [Aurantimonas sp. VKM B-3413]
MPHDGPALEAQGALPLQPIMTAAELDAFLKAEFPQADGYSVVSVGPGAATMQLLAEERHLRPGGTVSGPSLFSLADIAAYIAILAHIGPVALAVTTNLTINFLRKPEPGPLLGRGTILKLGKRLAVVEVAIQNEGDGVTVAHAVATYSIPPH